jgi:hypothetical protein
MPNKINLDAAQRTIEADSFLMQEYQKTSEKLPISKRIELVFVLHIKYNGRMFRRYCEVANQLEGEQS